MDHPLPPHDLRTIFRPADSSDQPEITELIRRAFRVGPNALVIDPGLWHWKYWEPRGDFSQPRSYLLEWNGRIVAHAGLWPVTVSNDVGAHVIDWVGDPDSPGAGSLLMEKLKQSFEFLYGIGGSSIGRAVLRQRGFKIVGEAYNWVRPLRPLREILHHRSGDLRLPVRVMRNWWWSRYPTRAGIYGWSAIQTDVVAGVERANVFFAYLKQCPTVKFLIFQLFKVNQNAGFLAIAVRQRQARVAGIWLEEDSAENWRGAFELAQNVALCHTEADEIVARGSQENTRIGAIASGMRVTHLEPVILYRRDGAATALGLSSQRCDNDSWFR